MVETEEQKELRYSKYNSIYNKNGLLTFDDLFLDGDRKQLFCCIKVYDFETFKKWARISKYKDSSNKNSKENITGVYIDSDKKEYSWCCVEIGMFYTASTRPKISFERIMNILGLKSEAHYEEHDHSYTIKLLNKYIKEGNAIITKEFIFALHKFVYPILYIKKDFEVDNFLKELDTSDRYEISVRPFYDIIIDKDADNEHFEVLNGYLVDKNKGIIIFNTRYASLVPNESWIKELGEYCLPPDCFTVPNNIKRIHGKSISERWRKRLSDNNDCFNFRLNKDNNLKCEHNSYIYEKEKLCIHCWNLEELHLINCESFDDYALDGESNPRYAPYVYTFHPNVKHVGYILGDKNLVLEIPNTVIEFKGINHAKKIILHNNYKELFKNHSILYDYINNGFFSSVINEIEFAEDVADVDFEFIKNKLLYATDQGNKINFIIRKITFRKNASHNITKLYYYEGSPLGKLAKKLVEMETIN